MSLTPEHDKRSGHQSNPIHPEISAAYKYVELVRDTADIVDVTGAYAWHGWALREAFLAGISYQKAKLQEFWNLNRVQTPENFLREFVKFIEENMLTSCR